MTSPACSISPKAGRKYVLYSLSLVLAIAVALPEDLPAAPTVRVPMARMMSHTIAQPESLDMLLVHCCHNHPLPPYDNYCCHGGAVVAPGYAYYGAAGVRGQSRRVARRTSRRVSRRR
jgi:hypothetical protein